jgi:hypothetical protein
VDRLAGDVMRQEPFKSARRVFWKQTSSADRGQKAAICLRDKRPNVVLFHTPVHDSWTNPIEIYFSIIQRKVLTPNDFPSLAEPEQRFSAALGANRIAVPMDVHAPGLHTLLARIADKRLAPAA